MKKLNLIIFFIAFFIKVSTVFADTSIVYLDMDKIVSNSKAGISILKQIASINKLNIKNLKSIELQLKKEEEKIIAQKNILSKEELQKKVQKINIDIENYGKVTKTAARDLAILKNKAITELLNLINPILIDFSKEKNISLILNKKNIIIGKSELDMTSVILAIVDEKIKKFKIK